MRTLTVTIDVTTLSAEDADNLAAMLAYRAAETYGVSTVDHSQQEEQQ